MTESIQNYNIFFSYFLFYNVYFLFLGIHLVGVLIYFTQILHKVV